jgi:hypothetical protein
VELLDEREQLRGRIVELEEQAAESLESESLLSRTLVDARRTADEILEEARAAADATLAAVQAEAEEARAQVQVQIADEQERARALAARTQHLLSELRGFRDEYFGRLRDAVFEHLAVLDRLDDLPEMPAGLSELETLTVEAAGTPDEPGDDVTVELSGAVELEPDAPPPAADRRAPAPTDELGDDAEVTAEPEAGVERTAVVEVDAPRVETR